MKFFFLLTSFLFLNFFSNSSLQIIQSIEANGTKNLFRPEALALGEKAYQIESKTRFFGATGGFDSQGDKLSYKDGESFFLLDSDLRLRYGYGENLDLFLGLGGRVVSATYFIGTSSVSTINSGIERYYGGGRYAFSSKGPFSYALEVLVGQSPYTNRDYASESAIPRDEVILGDGGSFYQVEGQLSYKGRGSHLYNFALGYRQPGNNLSPEFFYHAQSLWSWEKLSALIGVEGVYSTSGDAYSSNPENKPLQGRGPSYLYNSINHFIVTPQIGLSWGWARWRLGLTGGFVVSGQSTDSGYCAGLNLTYFSPGVASEQRKRNEFKEYSFEGTILKVSSQGRFIQIDQGASQGIEKGMQFDIYDTDFFGGNELVAAGIVYEVKLNQSIIKLVKKYSKTPVKKGFTARSK